MCNMILFSHVLEMKILKSNDENFLNLKGARWTESYSRKLSGYL